MCSVEGKVQNNDGKRKRRRTRKIKMESLEKEEREEEIERIEKKAWRKLYTRTRAYIASILVYLVSYDSFFLYLNIDENFSTASNSIPCKRLRSVSVFSTFKTNMWNILCVCVCIYVFISLHSTFSAPLLWIAADAVTYRYTAGLASVVGYTSNFIALIAP
jgi:hypothetical protein